MRLTNDRIGEVSILSSALLWGLFPVITILAFHSLSPLLTLAMSTIFGGIFFALVLSIKQKWGELKNRSAFKDIFRAALILGVVFYFFFFTGLSHTTAGNASIIALSEALFSYLWFNRWNGEYFSKFHIIGSVLMLVGAAVVLLPNFTHFQWGDFSILAAVMVAPLGNHFQRRARKSVSSEVILFARACIATPFILILAYFSGENIFAIDLKQSLVFLLINGFLLFGLSKILWIEGIHRISVAKANALYAVSPLFTLIFAFVLLKQPPTSWQFLSFIPIFLGMLFLLNSGGDKIIQDPV